MRTDTGDTRHETRDTRIVSPISCLVSRVSCLASPIFLIIFWPLTALVLFCDSAYVRGAALRGQLLSDVLAPLFLLGLLPFLAPQQRRYVILLVPFSALGEGLFSLIFGLYTYAEGGVPLYVPFGHAILLGIGMLIADHPLVITHTPLVRWALIAFHGALIGGAWLALGDSLSAVFGLLFVLLMIRKRGRVLYLILGVLVLLLACVAGLTAFGVTVYSLDTWHQGFGPMLLLMAFVLAGPKRAKRLGGHHEHLLVGGAKLGKDRATLVSLGRVRTRQALA